MASILLWIGIIVIVAGCFGLAWQAFKIIAVRNELDKFPDRRKTMMQHRNYWRLTILAGILILIVALTIGN